jgi:hypothetical protein
MGGFLYNKSPNCASDNFYLPYIESWKFFNYTKLAEMVQECNDRYLESYMVLKKAESMPTDELMKGL